MYCKFPLKFVIATKLQIRAAQCSTWKATGTKKGCCNRVVSVQRAEQHRTELDSLRTPHGQHRVHSNKNFTHICKTSSVLALRQGAVGSTLSNNQNVQPSSCCFDSAGKQRPLWRLQVAQVHHHMMVHICFFTSHLQHYDAIRYYMYGVHRGRSMYVFAWQCAHQCNVWCVITNVLATSWATFGCACRVTSKPLHATPC